MPFSNLPEQIRMNTIRSWWLGSIFAWILNTKAEKSSLVGCTISSTAWRGAGDGASSKNFSKNGFTPKLVMAEPKNIGVNSPARTLSKSNGSPATSNNSISSSNAWYTSSPNNSFIRGSVKAPFSEANFS